MKYMYITPGTQQTHPLFMMKETWNEVYVYHPGDTIQQSPIYDERNLESIVFIYPGTQHNHIPYYDEKTLEFNICISPRGHNTTIPYLC